VFGSESNKRLGMCREVGGGDEAGLQFDFEFGNIVGSGNAIEVTHGDKDGGECEGSGAMNGVRDGAFVNRANRSEDGFAELSDGSKKVFSFGKCTLKDTISGIGGVVSREGGFCPSGTRDKGRIVEVGEVDVEVMCSIFSVGHAEGHGPSGVMGDTKGSGTCPDGAEPVIVSETGVCDEREGD
jgi:hypothetical protein